MRQDSRILHRSVKEQSLKNSQSPAQITQEHALNKAIGYYPDGVDFQYSRQDKITDESNQEGFVDQDCYIYDVIYNGKRVSSVAVGTEDGSLWFLDMNAGDLWLSEGFMGLPKQDGAKAAPGEPVVDVSNNKITAEVNLYFANLDTIPELSGRNEGGATWDEKKMALRVSAVKVTGSVTGAPDGPSFTAIFSWINGKPEVKSVEYHPAPVYSHPSQVIFSGETMNIETDRLIEIAEYFKGLMENN